MNWAIDPTETRLPKVLIIGRPNVGKSTLFNRLAKCREALVYDRDGVTLDIKGWRIHERQGEGDLSIALLDSGGFDLHATDSFAEERNQKVLEMLPQVDAVVFVVDGRQGRHPLDDELWEICRTRKRSASPILLVANKVDQTDELPENFNDLYHYGVEPRAVSAEHGLGLDQLRHLLVSRFGAHVVETASERKFKIAFIGRPNVGKSTWCNSILGRKASVVSDVAGTTRDVLWYTLKWKHHEIDLLDTAGIRRSARRKEDVVEAVGTDKALRALEEVDVAILVIDASEGVTQRDATLAEEAWTRGAGLVVLANKWDLVSDSLKVWREKNMGKLSYFGSVAEVVPAVGKTGKGKDRLMDAVLDTASRRHLKLPTNELNEKFMSWLKTYPHRRSRDGRYVTFHYLTQTAQAPQRFLLFSNQPKYVEKEYLRYLETKVRDEFSIGSNPIYFAVTAKR